MNKAIDSELNDKQGTEGCYGSIVLEIQLLNKLLADVHKW